MYIDKQLTLFLKKNQKFISGANRKKEKKNLTKIFAKQEKNSNQIKRLTNQIQEIGKF